MGKAVGYFLILAGVSSGAYALMPDNSLTGLGSAVRSSLMATAPQAVMAVRTEAAKPQAAIAPAIVPPAPQLAVRPNSNQPNANTQVAQVIVPAAPTVVLPAVALKAAETSDQQLKTVPAVRKVASAEDEQRSQLARDIQRELKRVGCYSGDVNGEWTSNSRTAMNQFIERINATLPTDQPDHILKTLVQGHPGNACGKTCPAGQGLSNEGRCQPTAILAQQTAPRRVVTRNAAASRDSDEQAARPAVALVPKVKTAGWETKVVTVTPPTAAATVTSAPVAVALAPRGETPEGRMAVGAPASAIDTSRDVSSPASVVNPLATGSIPAAKPATPRVAAVPSPNAERDGNVDERRAVQRTEPERRPVPPQNVYGAPRPRYVAAPQYYYPPQQVYRAPAAARERTTFGPRIFSQMQRDGR